MTLTMTEGCMANSLTADGKEEIDMTDNERREVLKAIFEHLRPQDLNYVMQTLIPMFGDCEWDDEPCPTCGDTVTTYTWELRGHGAAQDLRGV